MNDENEPLSVLRVVEFALAVLVLALIGGAWAYGLLVVWLTDGHAVR